MRTAIIFGATGQDGVYLSHVLAGHGICVHAVSRKSGFKGDVADRAFVQGLVQKLQPDYIFHLAANSTTRHDALFENHATICTGTLNILESVRLYAPFARVFITGSAMQFKNQGRPIDENTAFNASSPYAVARIQATYAARYYRDSFAVKSYVGFLFNHDSPLRTERHISQKIVASIKRIQAGLESRLVIGDMTVRKEFTYAGDIVDAIWLLVNQDKVFECVIGSGKAFAIEDWVRYCCQKTGVCFDAHVFSDKAYTPEYRTLLCKPQRIQSLGWEPKVSFMDLADMMLEGCDSRLAAAKKY